MSTTTISKKKPIGFYICSLTFTFERMAFYSVKWMLVYFFVASISEGGLGLTESAGAAFQANFVAFTYITPVLMGTLADKYIGGRYCVAAGMLLMGIGYIVAGFADSIFLVYAMLFLVSVGTGLFKSNLTAMIGRLFYNQEELDAAFSTYYSFVNIGSFIGTTIVAFLVASYGYSMTFIIYGVITLIGFIWFLVGLKHLGDVGKKPFKIDERVEEVEKKDTKPLTTKEKQRVFAICVISGFSVIFWLFWYLAYLPVYYHWDAGGAANWVVAGFTVPSAWFDSLNALCCISLGPILGSLWIKLSKRPQGDLSLFKKTAIGLWLLGASYLVFAAAEISRGDGQASLLWLVLFGVLLSLGEMFFSPLGNSFVSKYAPAKILSVMMAVWIGSVFFASKTYGYVYNIAFSEGSNFVLSNIVIASIAIITGLLIFASDKFFVKMLEDDSTETV
ncbi:MAG: peptide MFS transporter [Lachnospirales bacterium]